MLKFRIDVRVKQSVKAKCARHPKYDPSVDEKQFTQSGCTACADIRALNDSRLALEKSVRAFERRAYQWQIHKVAKATPMEERATRSEMPE